MFLSSFSYCEGNKSFHIKQPLETFFDAKKKKSLFHFAVSNLTPTLAAVTDGSCTYFAEQAVKLLTSKVGFFIAHLKDIGGCLLRKIIKALGVEIPSVTSAKW
ncbi:hypothetical protein HQ45_06830 [Porphyromonas crevioricanis]|uniref:Uncharacterized protein n=2 Tax=Porphyromonas crevioricanis TaxID=393921 RepID=A0A0A2FN15_9PORP|nr:hypothetical protein HQ45_06830 [Porphyromonas crevioricanis]GAD04508.1 hypothetical protein PORCRE_194 [Porphyromonas crevioricanis JCM 15906]GAD07903.1 hypothetical protein PORCAN_1532 [Porphyromonas crevioricanis JCM 13913]SJZ77628.1 hypothetical protein SAMN02745203_00823 [Porphyromonas crevioricanis]SQH72360.1 Uncharacterised protein [Porphyromonas crevioricanis]